mmetsp:Transcript_12024/g.33998  ORF Transcript_12024/g.33998 Transcript_12024/m.33998 type:complete len:220 (+) Transcript_12024:462-1121(+)
MLNMLLRRPPFSTGMHKKAVGLPTGTRKKAVQQPTGARKKVALQPTGMRKKAGHLPTGRHKKAAQQPTGGHKKAAQLPIGTRKKVVQQPTGTRKKAISHMRMCKMTPEPLEMRLAEGNCRFAASRRCMASRLPQAGTPVRGALRTLRVQACRLRQHLRIPSHRRQQKVRPPRTSLAPHRMASSHHLVVEISPAQARDSAHLCPQRSHQPPQRQRSCLKR